MSVSPSTRSPERMLTDTYSTPLERSLQTLLQQGPLAVLAAGGATALWKGLLPTFEIRQAIFGASLLVLAALADMFVWIVKRKTARRLYEEKLEAHRDAGDYLQEVDKGAPTTR